MTGWWHRLQIQKDKKISDYDYWNFIQNNDNINNMNVLFYFNKDILAYDDARSYGTLTFTNDLNIINYELNRLAPSIMNTKTTFSTLIDRVNNLTKANSNKFIEDILIDQKLLVSGIGNYLKSEVLYKARISPVRKIKSITQDEWKRIYLAMKSITTKMFKILMSDNRYDNYMKAMKVYNKKEDPLGNKIKNHMSIDGRTTHWVPALQK
jgi:formamidopyrimidine-DNA glycosylase